MSGTPRRIAALTALAVLALVACAVAQEGRGIPRPLSINPYLAEGFVLYRMHCAQCHGDAGDGRGPSSHLFSPRPADFTSGVFKLRSTPSGSLPLDSDLARSIEQGLPGTAMSPRATSLSPLEMTEVIKTIKSFSPRFGRESPRPPIDIPPAPDRSLELVLRGREVYARERCTTCHGEFGRGDGPSSAGLTDDRGLSIRPHDFSMSGGVKAGTRPEDVYRSITTGLDGTPMHDAGRLNEMDRWALVQFLMILSEQPAPDLGPDGPHGVIGRRADSRTREE